MKSSGQAKEEWDPGCGYSAFPDEKLFLPIVAAKVRNAMMRGNKAEVTEGQRPPQWWEGEGQG